MTERDKFSPVSKPKRKPGDARRPEVIVDFVFEEGLLFVAVRNIGDRPALKVSVKFSSPFFGLGGTREVSALPLFRNIEFLAPHKEIATFLDTSASYFRREQPSDIAATISYQGADRRIYNTTIHHDLSIYKDIAYIVRPKGTPAAG